MCDKAVDNQPQALQCAPDCYKTQKICNKVVDTYPTVTEYVLDQFHSQKSHRSISFCV